MGKAIQASDPTALRQHRRASTLFLVCAMVTAGAFAVVGNVKTTGAAERSRINATADCDSVTTCYTPQQLQVAYDVAPLLARGIDGRGETVVLPELAKSTLRALSSSDLRQDFTAFDQKFKLPKVAMNVVTTLAGSQAPWQANGEEVLDTEVIHALAPQAHLTIVLVKATSLDTAASAVQAATSAVQLGSSLGDVISISAAGQTGGEHCDSKAQVAQLSAALQTAAGRHVTVVAASGDVGSVGEPCQVIKGLIGGAFSPVEEVNLPASDPLVLGVGGTDLTASHATGAYQSETAWGLPYGDAGSQFQGSGGGFSTTFARPSYQSDVGDIGNWRGVPDVSADSSPHTGMAIVLSDHGQMTVRNGGGTSESAPIWAAIIALADQYAGHSLGDVNPAIYKIAKGASYATAFHDVTSGTNVPKFSGTKIAGYRAGPGWDPVTGWGSPDANVLVPLLKRYDNS